MWSKLPDGKIQWKEGCATHVYDEAGLRFTMRGFLTNKSRARYGGENFSTEACYLKSLNWFMDGMKLFLTQSE